MTYKYVVSLSVLEFPTLIIPQNLPPSLLLSTGLRNRNKEPLIGVVLYKSESLKKFICFFHHLIFSRLYITVLVYTTVDPARRLLVKPCAPALDNPEVDLSPLLDLCFSICLSHMFSWLCSHVRLAYVNTIYAFTTRKRLQFKYIPSITWEQVTEQFIFVLSSFIKKGPCPTSTS